METLKWIRGHIQSLHEYSIQLKKYKFELLTAFAILVIVYAIASNVNNSENGSWSSTYTYIPPLHGSIYRLNGTTPFHSGQRASEGSVFKAGRKESNGELRTRRFLENYFNASFPKSRPDFMVNHVTGSKYCLELDCYNARLRLAVEFNGVQHYNFTPFFHRNKEAFYNQKYRDELKRIRCKELGITLIEIPYTEEDRLEEFLKEELVRCGF